MVLLIDWSFHQRKGSMPGPSGAGSDLAKRAGQRRIRMNGGLGINDYRQIFVIDLHGGAPILGARLRLANHDGDWMPAPQDLLPRQWTLRARELILLSHAQRFSGKNSYNSRYGEGGGCIDTRNTRMSIRTHDQASIEHARQLAITCIACAPGYFVRPILAGQRGANPGGPRLLVHSCQHQRKRPPSIYCNYSTISRPDKSSAAHAHRGVTTRTFSVAVG